MASDDAISKLLQAPLAVATFLLAQARGHDAANLAQPTIALPLAEAAAAELGAWSGYAAHVRGVVLQRASAVRELMAETLSSPTATWWSAPLERNAQVLIQETPWEPATFRTPDGPAEGWEIYAQKPQDGATTSTLLPVPPDGQIRSGFHAELAGGRSDWSPEYPLRQYLIAIEPSARVYEITGPRDWNALVRRYGPAIAETGNDALFESAGIVGGPVPTWSAVAADWDGIHLTFLGWLASLQNPTTVNGVSTTLWAHDSEKTIWLRAPFANVTELPELSTQPESHLIHWPGLNPFG